MQFIILILLLISTTAAYASQPRAMYQAYQNITYSLRAGKMQFECDHGMSQYLIQSRFGSRAKLYWRTADSKNWAEIQDVAFNDTNISFESVNTTNVDIDDLTQHIHLPVFNRNYSNIPKRYFHRATAAQHTSYLFIIDMVEQSSLASNIDPLIEILALDKQRYLSEQAYRNPNRRLNDSQKHALTTRLAQERTQLLEAISLQYNDGLSIHIPPYSMKKSASCYLVR